MNLSTSWNNSLGEKGNRDGPHSTCKRKEAAGTAQSPSERPHQTPKHPEHPKHSSARTFLTHRELHSSLNPSPRLQLQRLLEKTSSTSVSQLHLEPRTQFHTRQNPSKQGMNTLSSRQPAQEQPGHGRATTPRGTAGAARDLGRGVGILCQRRCLTSWEVRAQLGHFWEASPAPCWDPSVQEQPPLPNSHRYLPESNKCLSNPPQSVLPSAQTGNVPFPAPCRVPREAAVSGDAGHGKWPKLESWNR